MPSKISESAFTERTRVELDPAENEPDDVDEVPEEDPVDRLTEDDYPAEVSVVKDHAGRVVRVFGVDSDERTWPQPFILVRNVDHTGVSGTGVVAHGVQFFDNTVVLRWLGEHASTVVWASMDDALAVHGHDGATKPVWL